MNKTNNTGLQGGSERPSPQRFTAAEAGLEVQLVPAYVGDDEADWLLYKAGQASTLSRAVDILKRAAPRLGLLEAERRQGVGLFVTAIKEVGLRHGFSVGEAFDAAWAQIRPAMREAFDARAAELAAPHMEEACSEIRAYLEWHGASPDGIDRADLQDHVAGLAEECAHNLDIPRAEIFDYLADTAGLTEAELSTPRYTKQEVISAFDENFDLIACDAAAKGEPSDRESLLAREMEARTDGLQPWRQRRLDAIEMLRIGWQRDRNRGEIEWRGPPRRLVDPFAGANRRERFEVTMFGDLDEEAAKEWLIDDLLGAGEFSCFWGMPGCGKSVIVGDAAFHVASGLEWHGKPVKRGLVVFIAAERADLTKRRFAALRKRHGGAGIPLAVVKGRLDLTSGVQDARDIIAAVQGLEERTGERCAWIIIDTIARTFGAGDENKQADMGAYVQACDLIRDELSAHVTVIHHCSRSGEKPRGSIALDGAVDATFRVAKAGGVHTVGIDKENDAPNGGLIRFRMEGVELGTDSRGKVTTAPIAVPDTDTVAAFDAGGVAVALKGPGAKARAVLQRALAEAGEVSPDGRKAVAVSELRRRIREAFAKPGQKPDSLATIERREFAGLTNRGDAERAGEWIMLAGGSEQAGED